MRRSNHRQSTGASLVEALIAMAVMAFGMLSVVGVQHTLRFNADLSKQRNEATRLAEREIESIRATASSGDAAFDGIGTGKVSTTYPGDNTTFTLAKTVAKADDKRSLTAHVTVSWLDRSGEDRQVTMHDMVARVDPLLSGLVRAERPLTPIGRSRSRHPTIPTRAHDLKDGTSIFKPVESNSTAAWVFNNSTGAITHVCTVAASSKSASLTSIDGCTPITAQLLAGEIRFNLRGATKELDSGTESAMKPVAFGKVAWVIRHSTKSVVRVCPILETTPTASLTSTLMSDPGCIPVLPEIPIAPFNTADSPLDASDSEDPQWLAIPANVDKDTSVPFSGKSLKCYSNAEAASTAPTIATTVQKIIEYFCIVETDNATSGWSGRTVVVPVPFSDGGATWSEGTTAGKYRVCRYTTASSGYTTNANHPNVYGREAASCGLTCPKVIGNLAHQNFLIIHGEKTCPTDASTDPAGGDLINSNTLQHQPAP
jgi:Tfp pilus assembly protein PilV